MFYRVVPFVLIPLIGINAGVSANELNPDVSVTLDGYYKQNDTALSHREEGFGLGHTELSLSSPIDDLFTGRLTAVFEEDDGESDVLIEEAYLQTNGLPAGFGVRAGRFLSQVGYLNGRHIHEDDFVERPAVYRALLGSDYYDTGVRLNAVLPTPFFWQVGAEAFSGDQLSEGDEDIGVYTLNTRIGGDLSVSQSWQAGLSWLRNRQVSAEEGEGEHGGEHDHDHEGGHDHSHGASYTGENLYVADLVWKWSPNGNTREQQITLSGEYLYADDLNEFATSDDFHEGWYVSGVYQFAPQWSAGVRYGEVDLREPHGDHFHSQSLEETDVMLSWSRSHFSTLRLQYTHQSATGFSKADNTVMVQYVMSLGAHGAHGY
ncbi:TonB-dependent receptor [Vreelandella aquamarina]|uniref:Zinc-regulated TonB-dependent outer membrane receptor n=1 Tax=Vreelandella aquamarina TaxID=77097 RepID=A0A1N6ERD8_9GAMM|nr:hypothetical protein [Halomonas meridiana]SIN85652.1 hypothetical protein SAMN05878249_3842 [Halomonas meridiana]SIN86908.1 hypothetical protein SAMN05878438_3705 [Halomonas meridiana]SIO50527.1 hypothetical protein SAMN05878442_3668 [Halomonas meridiana]SIO51728.1 hypothetical protein SAMN05878442_3871 [Halomonas meridiana]GED47475.1 TonB-dependent receptor [Halomonas meridiana]